MDPNRAQALFESHHRAVYGFVLRSCSDPSLAEDLTQDVFVRALREQRIEPAVSSERPWLLRIARNLLIDRWRHAGRRPQQVQPLDSDAVTAPSGELRTALGRALSALPAAEREAFLLREIGGLSYLEIAAVSGATPAAVRSSIYRARRRLRAVLTEVPATEGSELDPAKEEPDVI